DALAERIERLRAEHGASTSGASSNGGSPDGASPNGASPDGSSPDGASPDGSVDGAEQGGGSRGACHGVGLVVPGMVDRRTGRILYAPRLRWRDVDLREALSARVGLPVYVESAPIACALARLWLSPEDTATVRSFAYVSVSDGVSVGLVLNGETL